MRPPRFHISLLAISLIAASPAFAQMGGGDMMPSGGGSQTDATVPYQKGIAALKAGDYAKAIKELRAAQSANSSIGAIPYALGIAYAGAGQKPEAKKALQSAVRTGNAPIPAYLQLGLVSLELGDRDLAIKQHAALENKLAKCNSKCGDEAEIKAAMEQLWAKLGTP